MMIKINVCHQLIAGFCCDRFQVHASEESKAWQIKTLFAQPSRQGVSGLFNRWIHKQFQVRMDTETETPRTLHKFLWSSTTSTRDAGTGWQRNPVRPHTWSIQNQAFQRYGLFATEYHAQINGRRTETEMETYSWPCVPLWQRSKCKFLYSRWTLHGSISLYRWSDRAGSSPWRGDLGVLRLIYYLPLEIKLCRKQNFQF